MAAQDDSRWLLGGLANPTASLTQASDRFIVRALQGGTAIMIVLSPEGKARSSGARVAALPRFTELNGKVVGLLDNSKPNADKLEERFAQLLRERLDVAKVVTRRKISAQQGAPKEYLDELASQADFILSGLGD